MTTQILQKQLIIKIKDPSEYYQKIIIHNNLKNYKDYLRLMIKIYTDGSCLEESWKWRLGCYY